MSVRSRGGLDAEDEGSYLCRESNYSHPAHCLVTTLNEMSLFRIVPVLIHRFQNYLGREIGRVVTAATKEEGWQLETQDGWA